MKKLPIYLLVLLVSCRSMPTSIFNKRTPHEAYEDKLDDKGLDNTPEGRAWLNASKSALANAQDISLPYRQHGIFSAGKPRALGLQFSAQRGERIFIRMEKNEAPNLKLYADVFKNEAGSTVAIISADRSTNEFYFDAEETGNYVLRLQPQLNNSGRYGLAIRKGASLDFPVAGNKARTGSFWGADRDGGKRSHEGIDIFAPKLTPAVAAADAVVVGVREGGLGGKTVWLRPENKDITLYYAHLDQQLVREGQRVKRGEVVGLVGNTGNAKHTPAHLHFGVYTFKGAVDPFPFVNPETQTAAAIPQKELNGQLKLLKTQQLKGLHLKENTVLVPLAANAKGYIVELPDGKIISVPFALVKQVREQNAVVAKNASGTERS